MYYLAFHRWFYKKIAPFKYHPKRNIGDQFMNTNNDIATTVLACNNNVTIGDKACFLCAHIPNKTKSKSKGRVMHIS